MNEDNLHDERNEHIADEYESAWLAFVQGKVAQRPRLQDFVPEPDRALVGRLLELDAEYAGQPARVPAATSPPAPADFPPGYKKLRFLGKGGMGTVFEAEQLSTGGEKSGRKVALKLIKATPEVGGDAEDLARFRVETEAVSRLEHPNIVRLYEAGKFDGRPFFSMQVIDGKSLKDESKPMEPKTAAKLIEPVARAVQHAHDRGVLHRDLKPGNILLDQEGIPYVADFGLAKLVDGRAITRTNAILGTPNYMSPEQASVNTEQTNRTDVYSLGAVLYELLTGRPPFESDTILKTLEKIRSSEPVPPSRLRPQVPRDVETICLKCLQKEPTRRYASAAELADDLGRYLGGRPIDARPVGSLERAWYWCRRNKVVAGLLAGVLLAVLLGSAGSTYFALGEREGWEHEKLARKAVEEEKRAKDRQLELKVATLVTAQLLRVAAVCELDPALGWKLLNEVDKIPVQRRDFAWRFYARLCKRERIVLKGHIELVDGFPVRAEDHRSVAFSPDGKTLASGSDEKTVRLWDPATGKVLAVLKGHTGRVCSVAFRPDGKTLASGSDDKTVRLWDRVKRQELAVLKGHTGPVTCVAFSPDGKTLASGSDDKTVRLWDPATGKVLAVLKAHTRRVTCVAFSPDGSLASGSHDQTVRLWSLLTRRDWAVLEGHTWGVTCMAFSPDGKTLASAGWDGTVRLWDSATGKERAVLKEHIERVNSVAFSPDGNTLASAGWDGTVRLWDPAKRQPLAVLEGHTGTVNSVAFSPDGNTLASAGWDGTVRLWDPATRQEWAVLKGHTGLVDSVAFSPDGKTLASASHDFTVRLWDPVKRQELAVLKGHTAWVTSVAFSLDGKTLASGSYDGTVRLWDPVKRQELAVLKEHTGGWVTSVAFSPDGKTLACGSIRGTVRLWDLATGKERAVLNEDINRIGTTVHSVAFSPAGKTLAWGSDNTVRLWDLDKRQEMAVLKGHTGPVTCVAFSPDGKTVASASYDRAVRLWDPATRQELAVLKGHTGTVNSVAFSPDGKTVASASRDETVRLWDQATGQERAVLKGLSGAHSLVFSPDRNTLASGHLGTVRLWKAIPCTANGQASR